MCSEIIRPIPDINKSASNMSCLTCCWAEVTMPLSGKGRCAPELRVGGALDVREVVVVRGDVVDM